MRVKAIYSVRSFLVICMWFSRWSEDKRLIMSRSMIHWIHLLLLLLRELLLSVLDDRLPVRQQRYYFVKRQLTTVIFAHCEGHIVNELLHPRHSLDNFLEFLHCI